MPVAGRSQAKQLVNIANPYSRITYSVSSLKAIAALSLPSYHNWRDGDTNTLLAVKRSGNVSQLFGK